MNKKVLSALALISIAGLMALTTISGMNQKKAARADKQGHLLTELWSKYYKAENADLPQKEEEVLASIAEEARNQRYAWDFYDAVTRKADVVSARNWKDRKKAEDELSTSIHEYDDPLLSYLLNVRNGINDNSLVDSAIINKNKLSAFRRDDFYTRCNQTSIAGIMHGLIPEAVRNDYEFVLWNELVRHSGKFSESKAYPVLSSEVSDSYPGEAFLKYLVMSEKIDGQQHQDYGESISLCNEYISEYSGKAASLLAKSMLLDLKKDSLDVAKGTSGDYRKLYDEASGYHSEARSYKSGIDSKIAGVVDSDFLNFRAGLAAKSLDVSVKGDTAYVMFRNMDKAALTFAVDEKNASPLLKTTVTNPVRSFYAQDTVKVRLDCKDDGNYIVTVANGKVSGSDTFSRHRLSIAVRGGSGADYRFYVADWKTGEPAKSVDLNLYKNGELAASVKDVAVDGFTPLPEEISEVISKNVNTAVFLEASCKDAEGYVKNSYKHQIFKYGQRSNTRSESEYCNILTDKKAFNPGETVKFKAVLYTGDFRKSFAVVPEGRSVKAELFDSEQKSVASLELKTNEYGSVAGEFEIPKDRRNGRFRLVITDGQFSGDCGLTVGDYVLPSFDVAFEDIDTLYFEGDTITVRGHVNSYSGHSLSSARASYEVGNWNSKYVEGPLSIAGDGSFEISYPARKDSYYYRFRVKVVDQTGETQEFTKNVYVVSTLNLNATLLNYAQGSVQLDSKANRWDYDSQSATNASLVSEDVAKVEFTVRNAQNVAVKVPVTYSLKDAAGNVIESGTAISGETKEFALKASGIYSLEAHAEQQASNGKTYKAECTLKLVKVGDSDKVLSAKVENIFKLAGAASDSKVRSGESIDLQIGAGRGPVWAVVELFDDRCNVLDRRLVHLAGKAGEAGSLETISFEYKNEYPDAVRLMVFYFRDGAHYEFNRQINRERESLDMPFEFKSFTDKALPGTKYSLTFKTGASAEAVAAIFDKSSERIAPNSWKGIRLSDWYAVHPSTTASDGGIDNDNYGDNDEFMVVGYGKPARRAKLESRAPAPTIAMATMDSADIPEEQLSESSDAISEQEMSEVSVRTDFSTSLAFEPFLHADADGNVSMDFTTSDKLSTFVVQVFAHDKQMHNAVARREMVVTIPVKVSVAEPKYLYKGDKYVLVASVSNASDKDVSGRVVLQSFGTTASLDGHTEQSLDSHSEQSLDGHPEQSLDSHPEQALDGHPEQSLDGHPEQALDGHPEQSLDGHPELVSGSTPLDASFFEDQKPYQSVARKVTVPAGKSAQVEFDVNPKDFDALGLKVVFADNAKTFSDAVFVTVPIYEAAQTVTEAHSAVVLPGADEKAILKMLQGQFTGTTSKGAEYSEIDIHQMLLDAIPDKAEPESKDVLSLSEALYVRLVARRLNDSLKVEMPDSELISRILSCQNADGGFGWFQGMNSNASITAVILERFAKLRDKGLEVSGFNSEKAVKFLDERQFVHGDAFPYWCGWLTSAQYAYVRSLYSEIPFDVNPASKSGQKEYDDNFKEFKKYISGYLVPSEKDGRGLQGQILAKARRISTLANLVNRSGGIDLAKAWGMKLSAASKMNASMAADMQSLFEYAVEHQNGGWYYPNAVMPWRGLLESELYAHSMLCDLLSNEYIVAALPSGSASFAGSSATTASARAKEIADGIRIWIMLQKETQHWEADPGYVDGINSVLSGSSDVLATKVIRLVKTYRKPIKDIKAAGNGFTIERHFYKEVRGADGKIAQLEIQPGTLLHVGDKVTATYKIHSDENRSFVKLTAPREAMFTPVEQISGYYGWWGRPISYNAWSFTPSGYRDVRSDRTEYFYDVYPEEDTTVSEDLYVTREGEFIAPVVTIESLYANHYRANDKYRGTLKSAQ
jgi:hypothetical protein